jgi:hypothetical protein
MRCRPGAPPGGCDRARARVQACLAAARLVLSSWWCRQRVFWPGGDVCTCAIHLRAWLLQLRQPRVAALSVSGPCVRGAPRALWQGGREGRGGCV